MKLFSLVALSLTLATGVLSRAEAEATLPQGPPAQPCAVPPTLASPAGLDAKPLLVTIGALDYQRGVLALDAPRGRFFMTVAPTAMAHLQEGDVLLVCMLGNETPAVSLQHEDRLA